MSRIRRTTRGESLLLNRPMPRPSCAVNADLLVKALQNPCLHPQATSLNRAMRRGYRVLPKTHFRSFTEVMREADGSLRGDLASEVLFCFPASRFDVVSPYRDGRYRCAANPGKEKQKSYDYRSVVLMVHRFRSSFVCSPRYCAISGARLRGNWLLSLKHGLRHAMPSLQKQLASL
jgi:hypothetical protein